MSEYVVYRLSVLASNYYLDYELEMFVFSFK